VIELSHVSKTYAPRFGRSARALDDVSLRVAAGEVAGISGPAGAGKSTLISLILGHALATSGSVRVDGIEPRQFVEREGVAYLPQPLTLPSRWRVVDALTRLAILSGVRASETRSRVESVVGLGAESQELLRDLIVKLRAFDRAILIASRDTAELQRLADRVTLLDRGRVRRAGVSRPATPANVETVFHLVLHHGAEHVLGVFPTAISLGRGAYAVRVTLAALNRGLRDLLDRGALLAAVTPAHAAAEVTVVQTLDEVVS